ncbi:S66 peptidase family protein [Phenylobacterium kunshanense]|uniref:S66 peptidase family protein n=1 Tax=Phenylobacterium kunshanense TaxID=1445034 RepID=UPI0014036894|nr:LD-carboxypeptidase [Phenylobacterium kunshanense]
MKILLLAPARWVARPLLEQFRAVAEPFGFEVEIAPQNELRDHQLAGPDETRVTVLNESLNRDDVDAIWCARGGYGAGRLLPALGKRGPARPLILAGYSDITALHFALLGTSVTSLHAAMPIDLKSPEKVDNLKAAFALCRDLLSGAKVAPRAFELSTVRAGDAEGWTVAANLSVFTHLLGTPYVPKLAGAVLCLEDVGEYLYSLDRMFLHLKLAGVFDEIAGLVLGSFSDTQDNDPPWGHTIEEIAAHYYAGPIGASLPIGHARHNQPIVLGSAGKLSCKAEGATLTLHDKLSA